jgi:hypothetical protein
MNWNKEPAELLSAGSGDGPACMLENADSETSVLAALVPKRAKPRRYTEMCWRCSGALRMKWVESDAKRERHTYECVSCGLERGVAVRG